ncbi:MAG: nucleotidyltransferase family protein [Clostridia bacterium]|nr:nucleotidyltransferase family protein [Clostridia bacterium]
MENVVTENADEYRCIFRLVKSAVNGEQTDISDLSFDWKKVIRFAEEMSFTALLKKGVDLLEESQQPSAEIRNFLKSQFRKLVMSDTNQLYELELLQNAFEENKIAMLLLKGVYFKKIYPSSVYRYMGDIDTYVELKAFEKADKVLGKLGYVATGELGGHDRIYHKEPFICLEQHFSLYEGSNSAIREYYQNLSRRLKQKEGFSYIYEMSLEDIYIFLNVHAIQHFNYAGIPPRVFLDYYLFRKAFADKTDWKYVDDILKQFGYSDFDAKAQEIAQRWFSPQGTGIDLNNLLDVFLINGETYGKKEHNIGIRTSKMTADGHKPSKLKFIFRQVFPSYGFLKSQNAILRKYPFLLPFVWVVYVGKRIFRKGNMHNYGSINKDTADYYKSVIKAIGLEHQTD